MISVVIPLYNKAGTIERAVASVCAQTLSDWELVVVDDGSRDDGPARVRACTDPRVRLVSQPNGGVSAARNRGVEEARSEWVAFLDADDFWEPGHLANLQAARAGVPGALTVATAYFVVDGLGRPNKVSTRAGDGPDRVEVIDDYFGYVVDVGHAIHSSAVMVRKDAFGRAGGFPLGVASGEDIIMWSRLACLGSIAYSTRATASYVYPTLEAGGRDAVIRRPQNPDRVGAELQRLRLASATQAPAIARFLAQWHRIRAMLFLELNERRACLAELLRAAFLGGPQLRDAASVALLVLPLGWRRRLLARWRGARNG